MAGDGELLPLREAAAVLGVSVDALRARIRRGTVEASKVSGRWLVAVQIDDQDAPRTDQDAARAAVDAAARIAALETDAAALRTEVVALRAANATLEATLEHERAQAASLARAHERMTLTLPAPREGRRRWPWPWAPRDKVSIISIRSTTGACRAGATSRR